MKSIRTLRFAIMAVFIATTFTCAPLADAETTALCAEDEAPCEAWNIVTHLHEETLEGAKAKLLNSIFNVACDVLFLGDALSGLVQNGPVIFHGTLTYTNCGGSCTVNEENAPGLINVLKRGVETARVIPEFLIHVSCLGFINCRYVAGGELLGTGLGPLLSGELNGSISIQEQTLPRESGSLCPANTKLDITTTPLEATYISS